MPSFFKKAKPLGGLFIFLGSVLLIVSAVVFVHSLHFVHAAAKTHGTVIRMERREDEHGAGTYAPVFTFHDGQQTEHTVYSSMSSYPPSYQVGEQVGVLYDPHNPNNAEINSFFSKWGLSLIAGALSVSCLLTGFVVWFLPAIAQRFSLEPPGTPTA